MNILLFEHGKHEKTIAIFNLGFGLGPTSYGQFHVSEFC